MRVFNVNESTPGYWPEKNKFFVPELKRILYVNVENLTRSTAEFSYIINTNDDGFRDFHDVIKKEGTIRILGLGDSFTFGNAVNYEDTYLRKLEKKLNNWTNVEIINLGVGGFSTTEEFIVFNKYGLKYAPDVVLLGFYINDFKDSLNYEKRDPNEKSLLRMLITQSKFFSWVYWSIKTSYLGNKMINHFKLNLDQQDEFEFEMDLLNKKQDLDVNSAINYTFDSLKKIKNLSDSIGAKLIVFWIPPDYQIYNERLTKIMEIRDIHEVTYLDYPQQLLTEFFQDQNITFIDFTEEFRSEKNRSIYWLYDRHLTHEGYSFLADLLYLHIGQDIADLQPYPYIDQKKVNTEFLLWPVPSYI